MTRINYGITASQLTDQHLIAELRELPRIPRKVKKDIIAGKKVNTFDGDFKLGAGHVRFFYDKLGYLHTRYYYLYDEARRREFNVEYDDELFYIMEDGLLDDILVDDHYNDIYPEEGDILLVKQRIATRIRESKQVPRYLSKPIDKEFYIKDILEFND